MRTTLNIDDDVLAAITELARREKTTAGKVASDLIRTTLTSEPALGQVEEFHGFRPFPSRGGIVTSDLVNSIRDEIGDE